MAMAALTTANEVFATLTCQPAPLAFDARAVPGLPDRHLGLDELRDLLAAPGVPADTSDAAWRQLSDHARTWGQEWVIAAIGVAAPGLTRIISRLSAGHPGLADDIESAALTGFLDALRHDDVDRPRIWLRWCWAAWRAGLKARHVEDYEELRDEHLTGSGTPRRPYGHPDLILGRAVAAGILTPTQADVIGQTRIGDVLIEELAATHGLTPQVLRMRRRRAELALVGAMKRGDL